MKLEIFTLYLFAYSLFIVVGLLKFEKPRINAWWVLSYLPLLLTIIVVIFSFLSWLPIEPLSRPLSLLLDVISVVLCCSSIALYAFSIRAHQGTVHMWHQAQLPEALTYRYTYKHIRHPIYTSYMLFFIGATVGFPSTYLLLIMVYGIIILNITARMEERTLIAKFSSEYQHYMKTTGRFLPGITSL